MVTDKTSEYDPAEKKMIMADIEKLWKTYSDYRIEYSESGRPKYIDPRTIPVGGFDPLDKPKDGCLSITCYGKRRTGKSFWIDWYCYTRHCHHFDAVYVFTNTKNSMHNGYEKAIEDVFIFSFDTSILNSIHKQAEEYLAEHGHPQNILIIMDDLAGDDDVRYNKFVKALYTRGRHHGYTIIFSTQRPTGIPPIVRTNTDTAVIFNQLAKDDMDVIANTYLSRLNFRTAMELITLYTQDNTALIVELWRNNFIKPDEYLKVMKAFEPRKYRMMCCEKYHEDAEKERQRRQLAKKGQNTHSKPPDPDYSKQNLTLYQMKGFKPF